MEIKLIHCVLRWMLILFWAAIGGVLSSIIAGLVFVVYFNLWLELTVAPVFSFTFVVAGALVSPAKKTKAALLLCLLVCLLAYYIIGESFHPVEYTKTYAPLILIVSTAFIGFFFIFMFEKRKIRSA